jgi:hypothetical protein
VNDVAVVQRGRKRWTWVLGLLVTGLVAGGAAPARADLAAWNGHMSVGYAKLFATDAPGGSLSLAAGVDHPITSGIRGGVAIGFHLLGTRTVTRGSLFANVDYSVLEVAALAHWMPRRGPVSRLSFGPALFSGHADLSTSGGGAAFSDLAVAETAAGAAVDATIMQRALAPVRVGLELGTRVGFLTEETWTVATARLVFHY